MTSLQTALGFQHILSHLRNDKTSPVAHRALVQTKTGINIMLQIIQINNSGDINSEYVFIKAAADCDIGDYLLTDSTYGSDDTPSNKLRHVFFFHSKQLQAGEYIVLYTKTGSYSLVKTSNGSPQHNLYWGLKETIWNVTGDKALLFKAPRAQRSSLTVGPKKK